MRLRSFTASDMPAAINMVRAALGESAIILSSESLDGGRMVSVTAAVEEHEDEPLPLSITPHKSNGHAARSLYDAVDEQSRSDIQGLLRYHNVPELFVSKLMQKAKDKNLQPLTPEKLLAAFFTFRPLTLNKTTRLMLVGMPGIGKTLTVAKIAARIVVDAPTAKKDMTVITTDNKRAGGVEQLRAFTDILGVRLHVARNVGELRALIQEAPQGAPLLIDTAGCNPYDADEMLELKTYASLGIEPVLAMQAGGDSMEAIDMVEAFVELPIKRLLVTRADTARRFGGVLASAAAHQLSFCNASSSASIIDALNPMDSGLLAQFLLRYTLQSS